MGKRKVGHMLCKGGLPRSVASEHTARKPSKMRVDHEAESNAKKTTNCRLFGLPPAAVGGVSVRWNQEHGPGGVRREQACRRFAGGFDEALQRNPEDVAGWEELHPGNEGSGVSGNAFGGAKTVWRRTWRSQGHDRQAE